MADDIKRNIAKVVRSVEWQFISSHGISGGMCFWRNYTGMVTLWKLDIAAKIAPGGLVYRAGPDERRDVVAFRGPGNIGQKRISVY